MILSVLVVLPMLLQLIPATPASAQAVSDWSQDPESGCYVYYENNGEVGCRPATEDEALSLARRDPTVPLEVISSSELQLQAAGVLNIVLRGTPQLDGFPQAKNAFTRAAAQWSAVLQSPVTILIDVDFGPTRFGTPFPQGVLGSADSQQLGRSDLYGDVRDALIRGADDADELARYNSLPQGTIATDLGNTSQVFAPSAVLRTLGLLSPMADPDSEQGQLGPPPSIGFNSNFNFDFDASDGITPGQTDFEAVAKHEIGHVLGFTSLVGVRELNPARDVALSVWDFFRFRPGTATTALSESDALESLVQPADFASAQRILSSGGDQTFFFGRQEVPLSTGRPDGTGGDGFQASHWQDDRFAGRNIGIMDPVITAGSQGVVTESDLEVFDAIGFGAVVADPGAPDISKVTYNGKKMTFKGKDITGNLQLEINFETVAPPLKVKSSANGKKATVKAKPDQLNLQPGSNQVRLIRDGLRSNVALLNL
jgi:hypothetical protein